MPLFFNETKQFNSISYNYEYFAGERKEIPQISMLKGGQEVLIPLMVKMENVTYCTGLQNHYRFNGEHFVYVPAK